MNNYTFMDLKSCSFTDCRILPVASNQPVDPLLVQLQDLAALPVGWEYGDGVPTRPQVQGTARDIYQQFAHLELKANAFPCPDGSLYLVFYAEARCVEIRIWTDGTLGLSVGEGKGSDFQELEDIENASMDDVIHHVTLLARKVRYPWASFDSSIPDIMIRCSNASSSPALPTRATEQESRWLIQNASKNKEFLSVNT